jgi:uncharacterized protein (DUF362 family)/Pyruvate/2-oxoacid:ferredoxin oxidoreductase delta subunit
MTYPEAIRRIENLPSLRFKISDSLYGRSKYQWLKMHNVSIVKGDHPLKMLGESLDMIGGLSELLPSKSEKILIKPNFGCHKTALTGATTDLRVLTALIQMLQSQGYSNIVVGDGGMAGYLKINILDYLGVPALCKNYGVPVLDLNRDDSILMKLRSGARVKISKTILESKVINLAKLKTHVLTTVSLGIKNLLGCVVGSDKREVHLHGLDENLANLPSIIKPRLTIIEGLFGMEGRGPVAGKPKKSDLIIASPDVIAADMVASRLMGFDPFDIRHITYAIKMASRPYRWGDIRILGTPITKAITPFEAATPIKLEANPYINRLKHMIRGNPLYPVATTLLSSSKAVSTLFKDLGILQEGIDYEPSMRPPKVDKNICRGCDLCKNVCPVDAISILNGKADIDPDKCVKCYCCVEICPYSTIAL